MSDRFSHIAGFYDGLVDRYGHDPRAADYGRAESQLRKFEVLAEAVSPGDRSILDVGCGFADYARFLRPRFPSLVYTGVDLSPRMIEEARRSEPSLDLRVGNVLDGELADRSFDVVNANGIFYLLGEDAWKTTRALVERMFALSRRMVAFTTLSTWAPDPEPGEFYADPVALLELCRSLSPRVVLRHDYHRRDVALFIHRESP